MQVLELIQSAAFKSGIVSSFNPDEIPGDIVEAGRRILTEEILPTLNCDRMIDITVTAKTYQPVEGKIVLKPAPRMENFRIVGYSKYSSDDKFEDFYNEIKERTPEYLDDSGVWIHPTDDFGAPTMLAEWMTDNKLMYVKYTNPHAMWQVVVPDVNIDFPPMRVDSVIDADSKIAYEYQYRDEFEQTFNTMLPGIYTTEEYEDRLVVLLKGSSTAKRLIMPVPLQIINQQFDNAGEIIAPPKFKRYLIDALAVSLAIVYGVSTVDLMKQQAALSYNLLKKNKPQPMHEQNVNKCISDKLRSSRGRVNGWGNPYR